MPAIVANPPVITELISDLVIVTIFQTVFMYGFYLVMVERKGRMRRGASVWPRKMLAAAFIDSAAVVPTVTYRSHPVVT